MQHVKFIKTNGKYENLNSTKSQLQYYHKNIAAAFTWLIVFIWILHSNSFTLV